jgi:hypothetical protein
MIFFILFGGLMFAVEGIYDGNVVTVKQPVPYQEAYDVVVTFLRPSTHQNNLLGFADANQAEKEKRIHEKRAALDSLVGIIKGATVSIEDARNERLARQ